MPEQGHLPSRGDQQRTRKQSHCDECGEGDQDVSNCCQHVTLPTKFSQDQSLVIPGYNSDRVSVHLIIYLSTPIFSITRLADRTLGIFFEL